MTFTGFEISSILKVATMMAQADGKVTEDETKLMAAELIRFGVAPNQLSSIVTAATAQNELEAFTTISNMTLEEKKYVTAYLGTMMCADGNIDDSELKCWKLISNLCKLPTMNIQEALEIMKNL